MGKSVPSDIKYRYVDLADPNLALRLARFERSSLDVFCMNDTDVDPQSEKRVERLVRGYLERVFPVASSFELAPDVHAWHRTNDRGHPGRK